MLALLLDEQISPAVAQRISGTNPEIAVQSIFGWRQGAGGAAAVD